MSADVLDGPQQLLPHPEGPRHLVPHRSGPRHLVTPPTFQRRLTDAHRPRRDAAGLPWPADPALRLLVRLTLAVPFVVLAVLVQLSGRLRSMTPNAGFATHAGGLPWDRVDPTWVGNLYPPITTVLAAVVPGGAFGLSVLGALAAGLLLHAVIEGMRQRGFAISTVINLTVALAANPLFGYAATQNLPQFLGIGLFGLGFADLVRFATNRDTQSGFRAGILLMLAALSDPSGVVYVVVATVAAPLLSASRRQRFGRGFANTLVGLFPTASAFGGVMLLAGIFAGDPLQVVRGLVHYDPARLAVIGQIFTTPLGWLWLAAMGGVWVIGLLVRRPGAVVLTFLLFCALVAGYVFGMTPYSGAGTIYLMMMLAGIAIIPAAAKARITLAVNAVALLELALAWVTTFNRPIVAEWLAAVLSGFGH